MRQVDSSARLAVELPAQVIGADVLGQVKAIGKVRRRPPLAMAGGQIDTGHRRVVGTDPAAQGDLPDHQHQARRRPILQALGHDQRR